MGKLKYALFQHAPLSGATTNLGILFVEESLNYHKFWFPEAIGVSSELPANIIQKLLVGIKDEVESHTDTFDISEYTRFFINDFKFQHYSVSYQDLQKTINEICNEYFAKK